MLSQGQACGALFAEANKNALGAEVDMISVFQAVVPCWACVLFAATGVTPVCFP